MRRLRRAAELGLPVVGVVLVLSAVVFFRRSLTVQLGMVIVGLLLTTARTWKLAPVLPSERKFVALRHEVDGFIGLVRRLNRATLALASDPSAANRGRLLEVRDEMIESVRRMEAAAGRTDDDGTGADPIAATSGAPASP